MDESTNETLIVREKLGKSIKMVRKDLGLTQCELAKRADVNRTYLIDVEKGRRNVAVDNIVRIARALGTTPSKLFDAAGL